MAEYDETMHKALRILEIQHQRTPMETLKRVYYSALKGFVVLPDEVLADIETTLKFNMRHIEWEDFMVAIKNPRYSRAHGNFALNLWEKGKE